MKLTSGHNLAIGKFDCSAMALAHGRWTRSDVGRINRITSSALGERNTHRRRAGHGGR